MYKSCELLEVDKIENRSVVIWHIDEVFIKAMNTMWFLWCVVDNRSRCLSIYLSLYRDAQSGTEALRLAKEFAKQIPDIVVSDEYPAYPRAIRKALGKRVKHVKAHFEPVPVRFNNTWLLLSNNRIEGFNSWLRQRVTILHGFKNDYYMTKYLEGFQKVWNSKFL